MEETIVNQMNLLLTQMRFIRRALEEVERSTSRYTGFAFTSALAAGPRFGQPPLFNGALKVHIININDLAPGSGFGAFLEGLLGGVGRFIGGLFGGIVGGTISSVTLAVLIPMIHSLAGRIEHILQMLGLGGSGSSSESGTSGGAASPTGTGLIGGSNLTAQLESITAAVNAFTGLFTAAASGPDAAASVSTFASTPAGEHWLRLLNSVNVVLGSINRLVESLSIALPIILGSLASFITRLGEIRVVIAETLQFLLRNLLMLRGSVLVTLFDTLSFVARFAVRLIGILREMVAGLIDAIFSMLRNVISNVMSIVSIVGQALAVTVNALATWLVRMLDQVLRDIGDTRVFRVITHIVRILPAILPPLFEIIRKQPMAQPQLDALTAAGSIPFLDVAPGGGAPAPGGTAPPPNPPEFPQITALLDSINFTTTLTEGVDTLERSLRGGIDDVLGTAQGGLERFGSSLDDAARAELNLASSTLDAHLAEVRRHSRDLASALIVPERTTSSTGLEDVANAYESWLTGGGLDTLLGTISSHFASPAGAAGVPARILEGAIDRPRATVEIDELLIEVDAPPGATLTTPPPEPPRFLPPGDYPLPPRGDDAVRYAQALREYELRGGSIDELFDRASEVT